MIDALIVGAGPAGSAVGALLAQQGFEVLLVDRACFPRPKPCGECLTPAALAALRRLGVSEGVRALDCAPIHGVRVVSQNGRAFDARYPEPGGLGVRRTLLDDLLLHHAVAGGARVVEGVTVTGLEATETGMDVYGLERGGGSVQWQARLVVGADGANSQVARLAGLRRPGRVGALLGCVWHLENAPVLPGVVEMHLGLRAYCGLAPIDSHSAALGLVASASVLRRAGGNPQRLLQDLADEQPTLRSRLPELLPLDAAQVQGFRCSTPRRSFAHRLLLVGDAAGVTEPFTGQGVGLALQGAEAAAAAVGAALACDDLSATSLRQCQIRRPDAAGRSRLTRGVGFVLRHPWLMDQATARLEALPHLADTLVGATGGVLPPEAVLSPLFALRLATGGW